MEDLLFQPGSAFGRYEIHQRIARGGMGDLWFATSIGEGGFRKKVVIKTIRPDLAADRAYVDMLINEASLSASLSHPNIVQVFDLGCIDGIYYIAMEYLRGRTLAQVLQRVRRNGGQLPPWLALSAVATACDGLQYAHDQRDERGRLLGLLHHDLSPSNLMLTFSGNVTLLDFGVARATSVEDNTDIHTIKGKYHYMAPERIQGERPDCRSDIYSLGVVLYQLLTMQRPFNGATEYDLLNQIVTHPPPLPTSYAPWLSPDIEQVALAALAKRPDDRYPNAYHMSVALRACLRRIGELHETRDRARYLSDLFPESPDSMSQPSPVASLPSNNVPVSVQPTASRPVQSDSGPERDVVGDAEPDTEVGIFLAPADGTAYREEGPRARGRDPNEAGASIYDEHHPDSKAFVIGDVFARGTRSVESFSDVFRGYGSSQRTGNMGRRPPVGPDFYRHSKINDSHDPWPWDSEFEQSRKVKDRKAKDQG